MSVCGTYGSWKQGNCRFLKGGGTLRGYAKGYRVETLYEKVYSKLDYGIDLGEVLKV